MREIKFRGKRIDNGEWVYGCLINNLFVKSETKEPVAYIINPEEYKDYDSFDDIEHLAVEVIPETVGQYTGLKDKNGKEIYEGDILHDNYRDEIVSVWWNDSHLKFECRGGKVSPTGVPTVAQDAEVIGNIHDNPHLLEG